MRPRKPHAKSEIGRRPDSRIEVGVLGHTDIVNNLATGKMAPREAFFGALYRNITHGEFVAKPRVRRVQGQGEGPAF